jgi:lipocalin-like protein
MSESPRLSDRMAAQSLEPRAPAAMTAVEDLCGTWSLLRWDYTVDCVLRGYPMGEDARGQIIYGPDGHMSAILMMRDRPRSEATQFHQATPREREIAALGYISYGGTWELRGAVVIHHVAFALFPNWIGTDLVREVSWREGELVLTALPEVSRSGKTIVNRLFWRRAMALAAAVERRVC